jgi:O-methyltransferase involved in polyketide biosynthesis
LQALNVLDAAAFRAVVARFPPGPIAIVNEGLLVYLDAAEKETLSQNIRECLLARGGCWITADIYLQRTAGAPPIAENKSYRKWAAQHQIEEKKFKSLADAEAFFRRMGFTVDKEAQPNYARLTSLARLREEGGPAAIEQMRQYRGPRLHTTWRLLAS